MKWLLSTAIGRVALLMIGAYVVLCVLVWIFQRRVMYVPDRSNPTLPDLDGLRDVAFGASDGIRLRAWIWDVPDAKGTVLLFHGNASNRGNRLFWMQRIKDMGYCAFVPDYRGYGGSTGSPSEDGLYRDGEASVAYARDHLPGPLVLAGTSIGSGVAVELATRHDAAALVLTAPMSSAVRVGQDSFPFLPVALLLKDRFDNLTKIDRVKKPILFLHGEADRIMPIHHSESLFARAQDPKALVRLPGVGHNDVWDAPGGAYWIAVEKFLSGVAGN